MSELKELNLEQLDIISGGTGQDELIDTSYTTQVTVAAIKEMALGTYLLVIENGFQYIGKLKLFTKVTSSDNSIFIDIKVEQTSPGKESYKNCTVSFQFCNVVVYSK